MGDEKEVWANAVYTFSIYAIDQLGVRLGASDISEGMTISGDYKQSITLLTVEYHTSTIIQCQPSHQEYNYQG